MTINGYEVSLGFSGRFNCSFNPGSLFHLPVPTGSHHHHHHHPLSVSNSNYLIHPLHIVLGKSLIMSREPYIALKDDIKRPSIVSEEPLRPFIFSFTRWPRNGDSDILRSLMSKYYPSLTNIRIYLNVEIPLSRSWADTTAWLHVAVKWLCVTVT